MWGALQSSQKALVGFPTFTAHSYLGQPSFYSRCVSLCKPPVGYSALIFGMTPPMGGGDRIGLLNLIKILYYTSLHPVLLFQEHWLPIAFRNVCPHPQSMRQNSDQQSGTWTPSNIHGRIVCFALS